MHMHAYISFIQPPPPPPLKKVPTPMLNLKAVEVYCICNKNVDRKQKIRKGIRKDRVSSLVIGVGMGMGNSNE